MLVFDEYQVALCFVLIHVAHGRFSNSPFSDLTSQLLGLVECELKKIYEKMFPYFFFISSLFFRSKKVDIGVIIFGSVRFLLKKNNQIEFFF
jgi:hypothetical protein